MSKFAKDILQGLNEALAHAKGEDVPGVRIHHVDVEKVDAKAVRHKLKLTQDRMAMLLGTSTSGYRKWEQGQRVPSGAARTLLKVMDKEPDAVLRALNAL
ncbi:helix-turn-helix domain-containing protein [Mesorhizobium australicum]|uniref:Putative transcriptional regulator n=1 Tax=Mesorhizobium australicum TaxID=536018 RepID=A0A1X7NLQ6_9HYPH|nr:type II toxin-antitoxin system MqsA family antitoxin [Mesorhizobium australicum]SMH38452.1 putative transcriptional regulator [Mesorhizobium australicum]